MKLPLSAYKFEEPTKTSYSDMARVNASFPPFCTNSFRNPGVAVPVVQLNRPLTVKITIEYLTVAVLLPPGAQLAIPHAVQPVD